LILRQEILQRANKTESFAEGFGYSLGNVVSSLTRDMQYEILQVAKKEEYKFLNSFGKSIFSTFNYLDLELQRQILSLKESESAFKPSLNISSTASFTDSSRSVQDTRRHYYSAVRYEDFLRIGFEVAGEDISHALNIKILSNTSSRDIFLRREI
jgi:hypothetical protein